MLFIVVQSEQEAIPHHTLRPTKTYHLIASMGTSTLQTIDSLTIWEMPLVLMYRESTPTTKFKGDSKILFYDKKIWNPLREKLLEEYTHCHGTMFWMDDYFALLLLYFIYVFWIPVWALGIFYHTFLLVLIFSFAPYFIISTPTIRRLSHVLSGLEIGLAVWEITVFSAIIMLAFMLLDTP